MEEKYRNTELLSKAISLHQEGNLNEAETLYRSILSTDANHFDALTLLGTIYLQRGNREEGVRLIGLSLDISPQQPVALNNRGNALVDLKRFEEALASYDRAIALNPGYTEAYYNRGNALLGLQRPAEALASYDRAIALNPGYAQAHNNRGNALRDLKRPAEALASYNQAIALNDGFAEAYGNRGNALLDLKQTAEALACYDRAIALSPGYVVAYYNRSNALLDLKRPAEALTSADQAIALNPGFAEAHNNRGLAMFGLKRYAEALACYDRAIALNPDYYQAHINRGNALLDLKRPAEALGSYDRAIALNPGYAEAYNNRGNAYLNQKRLAEALASYDRAIALNPDYAKAHFNKGLLKLLLGEYEEGWELYEWRWKTDDIKESVRNFSKPVWLGKGNLASKTILLHAEQGFGDSISICRYVPMVEALGAKVVLEVQQPLVGLFSTLKDSIHVVPRGSPLPEFECHCPLMSLPLALKTSVSTIPANIPYLATDPYKQKHWQNKLGAKVKTRIGLAWSGAQTHKNDHNRSIPLDLLHPFLDLDLEFHCLQKEIRAADINLLEQYCRIQTYENDLNDFSDTAALVAQMDLVISVDTSVAHLAGALGKPVWILLPFVPDYRWLMEREDSPWYPTARLFQQPQIGDWTSVISTVATELKKL